MIELTQEYNHHLAPVDTTTFCENATKMVTTSEHPTLKFFAGQSLDNQIVVYEAHGRFAQERKKKFACDIAISPDECLWQVVMGMISCSFGTGGHIIK